MQGEYRDKLAGLCEDRTLHFQNKNLQEDFEWARK